MASAYNHPFSSIKKMKSKNIIPILILNLIATITLGQIGNQYQIAKINNWSEFENLTYLEAKHHRINEESNKRTDRRYKADSLYLPTVSKERKKFLYEEYELKKRLNYKENRARYFIEYIEEDSIIVDKTFSMADTISTECRCEIKNDSLQIKMGIWVFGGFFYNISIKDKNFELVYIEDAHEIEPFKYKRTDTSFVENLELKVKNSSLIFNKEFKLQIGEQLNGHLKFESPPYFVRSNYRGYSEEDKLEKGVTKGEIYFTCKLREPFEPPEE